MEVDNIDEKGFSDAQKFLECVRSRLVTNEYQIVKRGKNDEFLEKYKIKDNKVKEMLLALSGTDCISIEPNDNPNYPEATVYKFVKKYELDFFGVDSLIDVYIKLYILEKQTCDLVMVISIHEDKNF